MAKSYTFEDNDCWYLNQNYTMLSFITFISCCISWPTHCMSLSSFCFDLLLTLKSNLNIPTRNHLSIWYETAGNSLWMVLQEYSQSCSNLAYKLLQYGHHWSGYNSSDWLNCENISFKNLWAICTAGIGLDYFLQTCKTKWLPLGYNTWFGWNILHIWKVYWLFIFHPFIHHYDFFSLNWLLRELLLIYWWISFISLVPQDRISQK